MRLGYWALYIFVLLFVLIAFANGEKNLTTGKIWTNLFYSPFGMFAIFPGIIGFYTFYFVLFERFLIKKKLLKFSMAVIAVSLLGAVFTQMIMYLIFAHKVNWSVNTIVFSGLFIAFLVFVHGIIGLVMKGFISWYNDLKVKVELNKKNHEMELELIRAQINPHFLFNTINNIDVLIQKDTEKASAYLNKLSDMMRFMLYETKTEKIYLAKELAYIEKYIELQQIRSSNPDYIRYEVTGEPDAILIEPMLFIPFIENAFKHAENKKIENAIRISILIEKERIQFECENYYTAQPQLKPEQRGLGNELIRKRLLLLYPTTHTLEVRDQSNIYQVKLILN